MLLFFINVVEFHVVFNGIINFCSVLIRNCTTRFAKKAILQARGSQGTREGALPRFLLKYDIQVVTSKIIMVEKLP